MIIIPESCLLPVKFDVRQGCIHSPIFLNTCIDWVMGMTDGAMSLGDAKITNKYFFDDVLTFAEAV